MPREDEILLDEIREIKSELHDTELALKIWRRRAEEADQKLLRLAKLAYKRWPDGRTDHDSMSGGCDAWEPFFAYEGREPPGRCNCGATDLNDQIDEILGDLKREI